MQINIKKLNPHAILPTYGSPSAAGADLYALLDGDVTIAPGETYLVHTGIALELPEGYAGLIYARSGLASKKGLAPANKVGVVDPDYRGEVMVALHNHSLCPQTISHGERVAHLVVTPFLRVDFVPTEDLSDTVRGEGGFGSTGSGVGYENAIAYYHGMGAPFDRKKAIELMQAGAMAQDVLCTCRLAYLTIIGDETVGIPSQKELGISALAPHVNALKQLSDEGNLDAMLLMGNLLVGGYGVAKNELAAVELYYHAAEKGYAPAANALGQCYSSGTGVRRDDLRAISCYRRGAEAGYAPAQFHLGVCYFNGYGIKVDKEEAAKWYTLAAEQGYAPAQFTLGKHHSQIMNGVENDLEKCKYWLTLAAEQGYLKAMTYLADIYHSAGNNEADQKAAQWYISAARLGDLYAMKQLSTYHLSGRGGVVCDPVLAKDLLLRAAKGGLKEAELLYIERYGRL